MPAYNAEKYIADAIDSILMQTYTDFMLFIVNDGSKDKTEKIINSYNDDRIVLMNNDNNMGIHKSLNKGIAASSSEFIARMDADDISHPHRLEKQIEFMRQNSSIGLCGTWAKKIGAESGEMKHPFQNEELKISLLLACVFIHPTVMIRRSALEQLGEYYKDVTAEDYDLWSRLARITELANIPEVLLDYRVHENQLTQERADLNEDASMSVRYSMFEFFLSSLNHKEKECIKEMVMSAWGESSAVGVINICQRLILANRNIKYVSERALLSWIAGVISPCTSQLFNYKRSTRRKIFSEYSELLKIVLPRKQFKKLKFKHLLLS